MKNTFALFTLLLTALVVNSQTMYSKAFGNPENPVLLFLHGGPGYNSVGFEASTAQVLSDNGFYVITYDRRGEGRSAELPADFTFDQTFNDLHALYAKYHLKSATLIGHSFGGIVATLFAEKYPEKTKSVILVGAPLSMQATLTTILVSSKSIYETNNDSVNLHYIQLLEQMDKSTLPYSSYCFSHAMQNGFYYPSHPSSEALIIYSKFRSNPELAKASSLMSYEAPTGFWTNENYTTLDLTDHLINVLAATTPVFGLYGQEDGLFSVSQVLNIEQLLGKENISYFTNCSHNVFMDQQTQFIQAIKTWVQ